MLAFLCHSLRYSPVPTQLASVDALLITLVSVATPQKPLSGDLTLIQIRFPIVKELSPFYLWLRAVDVVILNQ